MASAPLLKNEGAAATGGAAGPVLGVLKELGGDNRVSLDPVVAALMIKEGYRVSVEPNAGIKAGFADASYTEVGCTIASRSQVMSSGQVLFSITAPEIDFRSMQGKILISWVGRMQDAGKEVVAKAAAAGITLIDVTAVPRITIAQKLDVLSSQAKVAGHRAVVEATHAYGKFLAPEMTAAGKFPPSNTFVLGCGVAGLAAMGTSKALGSVVKAWDVRDVSDQVASMGAKWVTVDFKEDGAGAGGYAKESSDAFKEAQQRTFEKILSVTDIAITTAAIPGRKSPLLITKEAVAKMKPGSVIVDLAAVGGGNCELTRKDEMYVTANGITIIGYTDLPSRMASQSSAMYAQNMANLLKHVHGKDKAAGFVPNLEQHLLDAEKGDIVSRSIVCCKGGALVQMPPPPQPTPAKPKTVAAVSAKKVEDPQATAKMAAGVLCVFCLLMLGLGEVVRTSLLTTFLLAGAAGYQAVWGVAHALHTPLMSVTNAISGCTAIGGILLLQKLDAYDGPTGYDYSRQVPITTQTGADKTGSNCAKILAYIAIAFSTVNIVGGFIVSQRMLNLFAKKGSTDYSGYLLSALVILAAGDLIGGAKMIQAVDTICSLLCVSAIVSLASQSTANAGCKLGITGVVGGVFSTMVGVGNDMTCVKLSLALMAAGGAVGVAIGGKVSPIKLPQTVAAFHSLVGLAAMCTSIGSFQGQPSATVELGANIENIACIFGDFIGGVTLTGSIVAFGKLNGNLSSKPLNLPAKNTLNLTGLGLFIASTVIFLAGADKLMGVCILYFVAVLSMIMGVHLVGSVGGGDMPVCITVLNSYSGWALVAEGFLLKSPLLTIVGSLIGFSGAILTKIMCDAMNRDILNVIFGGMNTAPPVAKGDEAPKVHVEASIESTAIMISEAKEVLVVPGYGMAMARAQTAMGELAQLCRANDIKMKFGVHPVAGRMPGQMNVLLAEAGVPHEWVLEMDEVNPTMENEDVVLVVGANDVVNSAAQEVEGCAIWGMPVIEIWRSKKVIFCKRSLAGGYADLDNPVFYKPNTEMLLGDAKKTADSLAAKVRELVGDKV
jgi:NAD(P) transhydrogenase